MSTEVFMYVVAGIATVVAIAAVVGMNRARRFGVKLDELVERSVKIHKLVNGRLTEAYEEIATLRKQLADLFPGTLKLQREYEEARRIADERADSGDNWTSGK